MQKFIKEQLSSCKLAKVPEFDDNTTTMIIPRIGSEETLSEEAVEEKKAPPINLEVGKRYIFEVDDSLVHDSIWYKEIHNKWNSGLGPKEPVIGAKVVEIKGRMIKVESVDRYNYTWNGWLPYGNIKIVCEVTG